MISFKTTRLFYLIFILTIVSVFIVATSECSCTGHKKIEMRVLCAGSLMVPLTELEKAFELQNPDVDAFIEGHGSIQVIRHITELSEEADIIAVADHSLIPMLMYPVAMPDTDEHYASWYAKFATNSLGIAYTKDSLYSDEINGENWYEVLSRPDIKLGISDARLDACGYRAFMLLTLAEAYYNDRSIFQRVLGEFSPAIGVKSDGTLTTIEVPELLRPVDERIVLRGSSIRMLALLDSGDIDYAFEYRSVVEQHELEFLELPPEINLGDLTYEEVYKKVVCKLDFHRFTTVQPVFSGQPIMYGITIPGNAPHKEVAAQFIEFLFSGEGRNIFEQNHQAQIIPPEVDHMDLVPEQLRHLLIQ